MLIKIKGIGLTFCSTYLVLTALVSLGFIVSIIMNSVEFDVLGVVSLVPSIVIILLTLGINLEILRRKKIIKKKYVSGKIDYGTFFSQLIFEAIFNFKNAKGIMVGTNFITLVMAGFFIFLLKDKDRALSQ